MGVPTPLWAALEAVEDWRRANKGHTKGWCLRACRSALRKAGMRLPADGLAINCGRKLAADPAKWGWRLVGRSGRLLPTDQPSLVFFDRCGELDDGRTAGHIALFKPSTNRLIGNERYDMTAFWLSRIVYIFLPA